MPQTACAVAIRTCRWPSGHADVRMGYSVERAAAVAVNMWTCCAPADQGSRLVGIGAPETRYARSADVMIAYQVVASGPFDVILTPGTVSHVELYWDIAGIAAPLRGIAEHARLIFFDKRGTGLSDRVAGAPTRGTQR